MRITKYGHSCLLIDEGDARILIDPGAFSSGFEGLSDLDAICITHQHPDHLVPDNIKELLARNPNADLYADEGSTKILNDAGIEAKMVRESDEFEVAGVKVQVYGVTHAVIHPTIPLIPNVGYFIAAKFFYPGDAFTKPMREVDILALPAGAPWLKISEPVDYMLAVKPKTVIPVHDGVLSDAGRAIHFGALKQYGDKVGIEQRVLEADKSTEV